MRHFAIVGSGPAGFYTAEALAAAYREAAQIDILDRLPTPYGLIRSGVAPDHQSLKAVSRRYDKVAADPQVRFVGHVTIGRDVGVAELLDLYDAVVLATGAPHDRKLGIPGEDLPGVYGSAQFVGWYNGHPDFADLDPRLDGEGAVVVGAGNVALDCARILSKTEAEFAGSDIAAHALDVLRESRVRHVTILGRRGPHQMGMTPKELGEFGHLAEATPVVDPADFPPGEADAELEPGLRKSVGLLRGFAGLDSDKPRRIAFDFWARPVAIKGEGRAERVRVERTRLGADGGAEGTGEFYDLPARLVIAAIGYRTPPIEGVPYDERAGRYPNEGGRVAERLWAVGWARRGPSGTIGTNRPDGQEVAARIASEMPPTSAGTREGGAGLDRLLASRGADPVSFTDWRRIEAAETARARPGSPREKFTSLSELLTLLNRSA